MRESKAKKRILETADRMFNSVGYADLNVNEIAHEANVSIGTLYYHFPNGKASILMEIRRQTAEHYERNFAEKFNSEGLGEVTSFDEGLEFFLRNLIEIHREERLVLAAMDSEVLSKLASFDELAESVDVKALMESDARQVTGILQSLIDEYPDESLTLKGREVLVTKFIDTLIHRYVFVESTFGSEEDFIDAMRKVIRALLS